MDKTRPRILVVDDDDRLLMTMSDILLLKGFEPVLARSGVEALARVEEQPVEVALIDLRLGETSGLDVISEFKARFPDIECILLTGHASQKSAIEAIQLGAYGYFQKPFEVEQVLLALQRAVEKRESERFARSTVNALSAHIAILDETGAIIAVNDAWRKFSNQNAPPNKDISVHEGVNYISICQNACGPRSAEATPMVAGIRAVMNGELSEFSLEYPCHSPTERRWYNARVTRFPGNGAPRVVVAHENITARMLAEEALQQSEARFHALIEKAPDGIALVGPDGNFSYVSPSARRIMGYGNEHVLTVHPNDATHPDDLPAVLAEINSVIQDPTKITTLQYRFRHQDGNWRWLESTFSNMLADPNVGSIVINFRDIHERKQAEAALVKRTSQLSLINEVGREIVSVLDLQTALEVTARLVTSSFGFYHVALYVLEPENNQLVMRARAGNFSGTVSTEHRVELGEGLIGWAGQHGEKILANDAHAEPNYRNYFPELRETASELSVPLKVGERVLGVMDVHSLAPQAILVDDVAVLETLADQVAVAIENARLYEHAQLELVERRQIEAELLQHRDHLEEMVKERTAELVIAKENAEAASQAKSVFLAAMSHEIRTPLNGVLGLAQLTMQTSLTEKQRDYLSKIQSSGTALLTTINDILDFSKIEAGKIDLECVDFDLDNIFQSISSILAHKAREKNLELVFDIHPEVPRQLQGDSLRLGQVLTNLVGNAIKFTVSGEVLVKVNVVEKTSQQVALEFSVRDTGIGLSEAHLANLFQPFNQADSSTSRKYGGTGLGLTISQRLVNLMGGEIQAQSQLGQGSSFSFVISLTPLPDSDNERFAIPPELIGLQVLVADDHAAPRQFLKNTLEYFSFRVTLADSAQAALTCLESADPQQHFDLVLMDWSMPGELDGLEAIRRIKSHANLAATPALLLVNVDELSHQPAAVDPDSTLIKPIIRPQLIGAILQVLGHKTPEQNLPDQVAIAPRSANELRGRQVLLVEDNEINQLVVADMLKNLGMQVFIANDGEAAIQMVMSGKFEVVLMDIQMPGMDGYQATAQIRANPRFSSANLPIIAITAHALAGDRQKALDSGLNDYITKPVSMPQLVKVLLRWLAPLPAGQAEAAQPVYAAPKTDSSAPALLPATLDSFNMEAALMRLADNQKLYLSLLIRFRENYRENVQEIRSALQAEDLPLARRLAHSLKGVAATIGADELSMTARVLEAVIAESNTALYDVCLNLVEQNHVRVMASLAALVPA